MRQLFLKRFFFIGTQYWFTDFEGILSSTVAVVKPTVTQLNKVESSKYRQEDEKATVAEVTESQHQPTTTNLDKQLKPASAGIN